MTLREFLFRAYQRAVIARPRHEVALGVDCWVRWVELRSVEVERMARLYESCLAHMNPARAGG